MNILIVEDEDGIADFLVRGLRAEGMIPTHAQDGETALELLGENEFDVVVLDVMLPGISGHEVCTKMRFRKDYTPVLMLTALESTHEKIAGLEKGADDYLAKPFDFDELLARIAALRRRCKTWVMCCEPEENVGPIILDKDAQCVRVDGARQDLSVKEMAILTMLMTNKGKVMSRERILNSVWGATADPLTNTVDVHVARLRKKIAPHGDLIATVHGTGYRFG